MTAGGIPCELSASMMRPTPRSTSLLTSITRPGPTSTAMLTCCAALTRFRYLDLGNREVVLTACDAIIFIGGDITHECRS